MTTTNPSPESAAVEMCDDKAYVLVTWQTVRTHSARITADYLAQLLQVTEADVRSAGADDNLDNGLPVWLLADALAHVEDSVETFDGTRREDIELRLLCERCEEPSDDLDAASGLCPACVANNDSRVIL